MKRRVFENTADDTDDRVLRALAAGPYQGYAYSYPHKTAYRPLATGRPLAGVWRDEARDGLGLYVHIPFCEMRCGFCNLFSVGSPKPEVVESYLAALALEMGTVAGEIGPLVPASLTIGGGTPTVLDEHQLGRLFGLLDAAFTTGSTLPPAAVEISPRTATAGRLDVLRERRTGRVSIGVQSFIEAETMAMGRPQDPAETARALDAIRARGFSSLNVDLIYGAEGQTVESWLFSLREALRWAPEEMFLYPLYIRPLTGLDGHAEAWDEHRRSLYRAGRDFLVAEGYTQLSMRMFRREAGAVAGSPDGEAGNPDAPLLGLGCGARSRTSRLHYSTPFAVGRMAVRGIIAEYCRRSASDFTVASHGTEIGRDEQMRRTIIKGVLSRTGLGLAAFETRFDIAAPEYLPELAALARLGMLETRDGRLVPTAAGFEHADVIGPLLYAPGVRARMEAFELR